MYKIDYNSYRAVKPFNSRVRFLTMHYTAANFAKSVELLAGQGQVSAHYLVPDPTEKTYIDAGFKDVRIFNLVDEKDRAWHAGVNAWAGRENINDTSIGIEIVNLATDENGVIKFPPFNDKQIEAVEQLALNIIQRYPDMEPTNIIGHSDIAPGRKSDPGAAFPWEQLYKAGVGAWFDEETKSKHQKHFEAQGMPSKADIVAHLKKYGYDTASADTDAGYKAVVRAFQLHFRQSKYDGLVDAETAAILYALIEKYKN